MLHYLQFQGIFNPEESDEGYAMSGPPGEIGNKIGHNMSISVAILSDLLLSIVEHGANFPMIVDPANESSSSFGNLLCILVFLKVVPKGQLELLRRKSYNI